MQPDQRRYAVVAGVLVLGLVVALGFRALFAGEVFSARDLTSYYWPAKSILVPLTHAWGGVPLWNPLFSSGQPFASNPEHELFHPMTALLFLLPFAWAFRLQVLAPLVAGFFCMFLYLRGRGRSRGAALFGGLVWGFGGYLLSTTNLLPILFAAAPLPLVLLFVERTVRRGRAADVAGLAMSFGLVCLAAEPSTLLAAGPLVLAAALERRPSGRSSLLTVAGLALGIAIGGAALLPGVHHAGKTVRAGGVDPAMANEWSMPVVRLLELGTPNLLGHLEIADETLYWGAGLYGRRSPFFYSLYPGLLATILAGAAWWRQRRLRPWLIVAALGFLVALGVHFPLWPLLRRLPLLGSIRFPEKFALLMILPLTVAAAHGFDQVTRHRGRTGWVPAGVAVLAVLVGVALLLGPAHPWRRLAITDLGRLIFVAVAASALLRWRPRRDLWALAMAAALALDLGTAGRPVLPTVPLAEMEDPPPALRPILAQADRHLLFHLGEWDGDRRYAVGMAATPRPAQWGLATTLDRDFDLTQLAWSHRATNAFFHALGRDGALLGPLLRRRGVTDLLRFAPGTRRVGDLILPPPGSTSALVLLAAQDPNPVAFAALRAEPVRGEEDWVKTVRSLGEEVVRTVCLEPEDLVVPSPATVAVVDRRVDDLTLDVDAAGPRDALVAVNQTWDPGWRASVDDQPARVLRADLDLQAVLVPPGRHRVILWYADHWVTAGLFLTGLGCLGCLGLVLRRRA